MPIEGQAKLKRGEAPDARRRSSSSGGKESEWRAEGVDLFNEVTEGRSPRSGAVDGHPVYKLLRRDRKLLR